MSMDAWMWTASRQCCAICRSTPTWRVGSLRTRRRGWRCGTPLARRQLNRSRRGWAWNGWHYAAASQASDGVSGLPPHACCWVLGLGGVGGWFLHGGTPRNLATIALLTQAAVSNHMVYTADKRRPTELGATQRDDLARWVSNRLNHQVAPPDLSGEGYSYMGGRLAATPDGPAGLFMYASAQGVRLTVFVLPLRSAGSAPIQHVDFAHVDGCAWIDKSIGYTVVGDLPPAELRRLAELVRRQFEETT